MAREMGSGWEANIAKLIEKANETLAGSAQSRSRIYCSSNDRGGSCRSCGGVSSSSSRSRVAFALSSAPKTFRGERSASYRCGTGGWDTSLLGDRSRVPLPLPDGCPSNLPQAPTRLSSFSRPAEIRVNDARIVGMEDRIKLEVQTLVRSDVDQRVSLGERATESLRRRVDEAAEEVSRLRGTVFELNAGMRSQGDSLEQVLADSKRNRTSLGVLEKWQQERNAWFARADGTLSSLAEDNQTLTRRAHTQQRVMEEALATQEDLTVAMTRARRAAETATASALAPVREHFLEEIKSIRKRLLGVERGAKEPVIPTLARAEVKSIAQEIASAEAKELWTRMETHMKGSVEDCTRKPYCGSVGSRFGEKKRHADGPSSILLAAIRRKSILRRAGRQADSSRSLPEAREVSVAPTSEVSRLQCTVSALQQRLDNALGRMEESLRGELRQNRPIVEREASKPSSDDPALSAKDLDARIKRLEELELRRKPQSLDGPTKAGTFSSVLVDKMENVFERVQALESGEALAIKRQASADNRIEEMSEQLCGHSLKLHCLDGLWREAGCANCDNKLAAENDGCGSGDSGGHSNGEGISSTSAPHVNICPLDGQQGQQQEQQEQQDNQEHCADQQLHHAVSAGREEQVSASTKTLRSGLSSFLKRLGSSTTLSTSIQGHGRAKTGERHSVEERAQTQFLIATTRDAEKESSRHLHERSTVDAHVVSRVGENAGSVEQAGGNTVVSGVVSKSSEETQVQPEALGQDTRDTNTKNCIQLAKIGSRDPSVIDVDQHRPTRNRPGIEDDGTLHTPSDRGGQEQILHDDAECGTHPNQRMLENSGSVEQVGGNTVVSGVVSKSGEETQVQPEVLGQDTRDTNTKNYIQLAKIGSRDPSVIDVDQHRPTRKRPGIEDDGTLHTPSDRGGREQTLHDDAECGRHPNQRMLLHESDPTSAASEGGATEDHGQKLHGGESEQRRQGDVCGIATSSNTRADSFFPAAITTPGVEAFVALQDDQNRGVHDEKGLKDSASVDGSVRSRWSLPDTAPLGLAGLHEQRAIWAEGSSEEDSIDTCDQILSSESGERQRDSKSSRSRVESYDLTPEMGDGCNTPPFSPSVVSIQSEPPASSPQVIVPGVETIFGSQGTTFRHTTGDPKTQGDDVKAERALSSDSSASATFAPATPEPVRVGVANIRVSVERTERPGRGGDSVTDGRSLASPSGAIEEIKAILDQSGDASNSGQEERVRSFSSDDIDDGDKASWDSDSLTSESPQHRPRDSITSPDSSGSHNLDDDERGEESRALPGVPNTAPGTWATPDFGFSSDEEGDLLDFRKPVSELSSSGVVEEARGHATPPPPPSSCLTRGIVDGFDSSSSSSSTET